LIYCAQLRHCDVYFTVMQFQKESRVFKFNQFMVSAIIKHKSL
jgi:hypothetical protein